MFVAVNVGVYHFCLTASRDYFCQESVKGSGLVSTGSFRQAQRAVSFYPHPELVEGCISRFTRTLSLSKGAISPKSQSVMAPQVALITPTVTGIGDKKGFVSTF